MVSPFDDTQCHMIRATIHIHVLPSVQLENIYSVHIANSQTCSNDHLYIQTSCLRSTHWTGPQKYTCYVIEPVYKDHLHIRTT